MRAAWTELGLDDEWIGKGNREIQTLPVLHLRESAQKMGLLRKYRGKLLLTGRGRNLRADAAALWRHLAERLPLKSRDLAELQAGLTVLVAVAADSSDRRELVTRVLSAIGWVSGDGSPLTTMAASHAAWDTMTVLWRIGAVVEESRWPRTERLTPEGVTFARAALHTFPS